MAAKYFISARVSEGLGLFELSHAQISVKKYTGKQSLPNNRIYIEFIRLNRFALKGRNPKNKSVPKTAIV
jgi:hypothetical protein